jgi:dGTPase
VELWRDVSGDHAALTPQQAKYLGVRGLINAQVLDAAQTVEARVAEWGLDSPDGVRTAPDCVAGLSPRMTALNAELREFLMGNVYQNHHVYRMSIKAGRVLEALFRSYQEFPRQLPPGTLRTEDELTRDICDYLASLTDREALDEHRRLFDPSTRI